MGVLINDFIPSLRGIEKSGIRQPESERSLNLVELCGNLVCVHRQRLQISRAALVVA